MNADGLKASASARSPAKDVHIIIALPAFSGGGAERIGVLLANDYHAKGITVSVLVFRRKGPLETLLNKAIPVISLETHTKGLLLSMKLAWTLKAHKPTTVISMFRNANTPLGLSRYFFSDYRLVLREANTLAAIAQRSRFRQWKSLTKMRLAYPKADLVLSNSADALDELAVQRITSQDESIVIGNPVDTALIERLAQESSEHPWLNNSDVKVVINVGRLHFQKNQKLLINAFAKAHGQDDSLRLMIIGDGNQKASLTQAIDLLGLTDVVALLDYTANPFKYVSKAKVFVLTSRWEGFPNVLIEAMVCRTPVISTNCPGAPKDILQHGKYGLLTDESPESIAMSILKVLDGDHPSLEAAREAAERYSFDKIATVYLDCLIREA